MSENELVTQIYALEKQRDELREALSTAVDFLETELVDHEEGTLYGDMLRGLQATLASTEKDQT